MQELKQHFITVERPWQEGAVEVLEQKLPEGRVKKATLAITALGVYEAQINGVKAGDHFLAPGYTYYPRHLTYQIYDVTPMLSGSADTLRVYLGQGWYCGRFTCDNKTQIYGPSPAVSWILTMERTDGTLLSCRSDDPDVSALVSPYDYAGLYDGEIYYAAGAVRENTPQPLAPARYTGTLPETLEKSTTTVRVREEIPVRAVLRRNGTVILDFGQNLAGIVQIDPTKMDGNVLKLRHGEILNADGSLYTANLRSAKAELVYHKGEDTSVYRPRFTYMGFRYVELTGTEYRDGLLTAFAVYSDMERTGYFRCENKLVQKLYENQFWGQKSNYVEVPTDCPQRDERMGYTGDGHVFALTGSYNFDTELFWAKFLKDIRYSQMDNSEGYVAPTIPAQGPAGVGFLSMLGWGNAVTILPEMLYLQYGTDRYLREQYDSMKLFVECEMRKMGDQNLWLGPSLGDWLMLGKDVAWMAMHNGPVSNAFIVNDLRILSETAGRLGKKEDASRCAAQLEKTRNAYIAAFVEEDGRMKDDYQGAYIMALKLVLPKGELWDKVYGHLVENIRENGMQTGFFSTEHLLPLLAENGDAALAWDLLMQEACPGWMYQVLRGATTTWERWDALRPDGTVNETKMTDDNMVSFNHYAFGSVGEFYYQYILGIRPLEPGYRKIRIRPFMDQRLGTVSGSYQSRAGVIRVEWSLSGGKACLTVETPAETLLCLPDGTEETVPAGRYSRRCAV